MRPLTSSLPGRDRARALRPALIIVLAVGAGSCSGTDNASTSTTVEATVVPDPTALAPGECDPAQTLAAPEITTGGTTTPATLGIGDFDCGGLTGDGYISFNYNPVLIDGEDTIEVAVGDGVTATISWTGDQPFTESGAGRFASTLERSGCSRLTIELTGAVTGETGTSTATYGADIRVGGDAVDCPQRLIDPSDPSDGDTDISFPSLPDTSPQRTDPATTD